MPKLVRVEMEFDDGKVQRLSGDVAEEWLQRVNGFVTLAWVHGSNFPEFKWEEIKKENTNG